MHVKDLIRALGGNARVAAALNVTPQTISEWFARDSIPARHHIRLWAMARHQKVRWQPPDAEFLDAPSPTDRRVCTVSVAATKLHAYRHAQRLTLDAFGALIGVSGEAVRKWEAAERIPRRGMMARIQQVTGGQVTPADFYAGHDQAPEPAPRPEQVAA